MENNKKEILEKSPQKADLAIIEQSTDPVRVKIYRTLFLSIFYSKTFITVSNVARNFVFKENVF